MDVCKLSYVSTGLAKGWPSVHEVLPSVEKQCSEKTVPWLRRLVAGLSPWWSGLAPRSVHEGFVVDTVALGQIFLRVLLFSPVNILPHVCRLSGGWIAGPLVVSVWTHRLTPSTWTTTTTTFRILKRRRPKSSNNRTDTGNEIKRECDDSISIIAR
jgi:hypothetical protein